MMSSPVMFHPLQSPVLFGHSGNRPIPSSVTFKLDQGQARFLKRNVEQGFTPQHTDASLNALIDFARASSFSAEEQRFAFLQLIGYVAALPHAMAQPKANKAYCELYPTVAAGFNNAFKYSALDPKSPIKAWKAFAHTTTTTSLSRLDAEKTRSNVEHCFIPATRTQGQAALISQANDTVFQNNEQRLAFLQLIGYVAALQKSVAAPTISERKGSVKDQQPVNPNEAYRNLYPSMAAALNTAFNQSILPEAIPKVLASGAVVY